MKWTEGLVADEAYWATWPEHLSVTDLAQIARKKPTTIWRWLLEGKIPAHLVAGSWIVYREVFQHVLDNPDVPYPLPLELLGRYPDELTVLELGELLGKQKKTAWRWLSAGKLPGVGVLYEGFWLINKGDLVELLKRTSNQAPPAEAD